MLELGVAMSARVREVISLVEEDTATADLHNAIHHFDRMMRVLRRKCEGNCSLKRRLEEYCAFRLGVLWFEKHYGVSFDDEPKLIATLKRIVEDFELSERTQQY